MRHNYHPVSAVFVQQGCFSVPLFQRPYVWTEDEQWKPLWDDIRRVADSVCKSSASPTTGANPTHTHFLGSVVLEQLPSATGHLGRREIIDGQQRLTTLQLFLKAAHDATKKLGADVYAGQFEDLVFNRHVPATDPDGRFKVWPTDADQTPYRAVMVAEDGAISTEHAAHRLSEAYRFFRKEIGEWLGAEPGQIEKRAEALSKALSEHIRLIVLDVDPGEDAQVIFETLNARGTPLLPLDLVKNWLLREAARTVGDPRPLYEKYWKGTFDRKIEYWREEVGRGHAQKPRADLFLQNHLAIRLRDEVTTGHLFFRFLQDINSGESIPVPEMFSSLERNAGVFQRIDEPDDETQIGRRLNRLKQLDVVTIYPLLMITLQKTGEVQTLKIFEMIESYLVRRSICGLNTRGYGRFFIDAACVIADAPLESVPQVELASFLARSDAEAVRWPDDKEFSAAWRALPAYRRLARATTRFVLSALEEKMRREDDFGEAFEPPPKLEIEHVMPVSWEANWAPPIGEGPASRLIELRNEIIHTFGNLTLVTSKLNKRLSNAAWTVTAEDTPSKRDTLKAKSLTKLRDAIVDKDEWTDARIGIRTDELLEWACKIWPAPTIPTGTR